MPRFPSRPELGRAMPDCRFYPIDLDPRRRTIAFANISRDTYRQEGFLAPNAGDLGRRQFVFNLDDLLLRGPEPAREPCSVHFILISAFCCSTLMARYFDLVPGCLVLREPSLLGQLALLRRRTDLVGRAGWEEEWKSLTALGLALVTRTFEAGETVIVKAADVVNNMGEVLAEAVPEAKFILLSIPLRLFVLSVLKSEKRREWMRARARFWNRQSKASNLPGALDLDRLDDGRKSAYLWACTDFAWRGLRNRVGAGRVLAMDGGQVSARAAATMKSATSFLSLVVPDTVLEAIAQSKEASQHAKRPHQPYDAEKRESDIANWEDRYGAEADAACAWAMNALDCREAFS